jgi:hypothetical protein
MSASSLTGCRPGLRALPAPAQPIRTDNVVTAMMDPVSDTGKCDEGYF